MIQRESMVVYQSWLEAIHELPEAMQGELALAILEVGLEGQVTCKIGQTSKAMLALIRPMIEANNKRYENGCKGGRKPKENQTETEEKPNENQNRTYNDICNMINDKCIMGEDNAPTPAREKVPDGTFIPTTSLFEQMTADTEWLERVAKNTKSTVDAIRKELSEFCEGLMLTEDAKELTDARRHFISWRRKRQQVAGNPVAGGRPYRMLTYEQMLNEMGKNGTTMAAYTKVVVSGKEKPLWVTKADKLTYNIPDAI